MKKEKTTSWWKKEADMWFSRFIRQRDKGHCYTCELSNNPKKMQCGHFIPRQYLATRYDEKNNHCQCYGCNMIFNGQPSVYAINLIQDYGDNIIKELEAKRQLIMKDMPYKKIAADYKLKYESLLKEENVL